MMLAIAGKATADDTPWIAGEHDQHPDLGPPE
jgi:hypothetical protein